MSDKDSRFSELRKIPVYARMDHRNTLKKSRISRFRDNLSRKERRKLDAESKKLSLKYQKIIASLHNSGTGFPVDKTLRSMAVEYTHRFASSGTENMPVSFNYFEAFCDLKLIKNSVAPYVSLAAETNHLFNASDFFDFLTSNDCQNFTPDEFLNVPEAQILHFSNNGSLEELTFFDASGWEYILSGFSMIRRGSTVHWFLVVGEKLNREEWELRALDTHEVKLEGVPPWKRAFMQDVIDRNGANIGPPMRLEGTETAVKTLVAGEFDVSTKKHIGKSIFVETENSYTVFSDDPDVVFSMAPSVNKQQVTEAAMERIRQADVLWSIAEGLFQLPKYFETRVTISQTKLNGSLNRAGLKGKGGRGVIADYVAVEAVSIENSDSPPSIRRISMPIYSTETEGHWRRLPFGQTGKDRDGKPAVGKTWVNKSNTWRDDKSRKPIIYVKDCLSVAKTQIEKIYAATETINVKNSENTSGGELYVLRCALFQEEVYKVGWTSGSAVDRAKQLSSATGVPLAFVIVESWEHIDPEALETEIHAQLAPYRVNNKREFFRLNFNGIREIIVRTIERVGTIKRAN